VALPTTSVSANYSGCFYIQEASRASGIRVDSGATVSVEQTVQVFGRLALLDGCERVLVNCKVVPGTMGPTIKPLFMVTRAAGGGDWNPYAPGITDASGLNNIGLLICTTGRITYAGTDHFYIDDGSELRDGTLTGTEANIGVRVICDPAGYSVGDCLEVTGIGSCFRTPSDDIARRILARGSEDVRKVGL
jgi:hypothetical protein